MTALLSFRGDLKNPCGQTELPADTYQFTSIELKQLAFRLDGLFLPPINQPNLPIYFVQVQFQKDDGFYYHLFAKIFLYLYQDKPVNNWRAVVVYPRRSAGSEQPVQYQPNPSSQLSTNIIFK